MKSEYEIKREAEKAKDAEVAVKLQEVFKILKQKVKERPETENWDCRVESDQIYISFSAGYGDKRLHVSGNYPRNADGSYIGEIWYTVEEREARKAKGIVDSDYGKVPQPRISISADKTAEQIAKDIQRRFIPDYLDYRARVQKRVDDTNDYESSTKKSLETVKGSQLTDYEVKEHRFSGYTKKNSEGIRYEVKASRKDIDVELHNLTVEQAQKVLEIIKKK